jgi:hypothetical protein
MHGDAQDIRRHSRDRVQVFDRIILWPALEQSLVDMGNRTTQHKRVAVRTSARDRGNAQRTAAAADVFNHDGTEQWLHFIRPWATDSIECTTGRKRNHEPDRPGWVGLRPRSARDGRQRGSARGQIQKLSSVGKFHGVLSLESTRRHKHIALATISQEFAALRDFDSVYVGSGSKD